MEAKEVRTPTPHEFELGQAQFELGRQEGRKEIVNKVLAALAQVTDEALRNKVAEYLKACTGGWDKWPRNSALPHITSYYQAGKELLALVQSHYQARIAALEAKLAEAALVGVSDEALVEKVAPIFEPHLKPAAAYAVGVLVTQALGLIQPHYAARIAALEAKLAEAALVGVSDEALLKLFADHLMNNYHKLSATEESRQLLALVQSHYQARIAAEHQQGYDDGRYDGAQSQLKELMELKARIAALEAQVAEAANERERILGELEDIRCSASGEYLPGIERLMQSLKGKENK